MRFPPINPSIVRAENGERRTVSYAPSLSLLYPSLLSGGERIVILGRGGRRMLVSPVRTLKGDRSSIGCLHCVLRLELYVLTGSTFFSPLLAHLPRPLVITQRFSSYCRLRSLESSSRARIRDHRGTAERAKVEQERVSKERPSDAPS